MNCRLCSKLYRVKNCTAFQLFCFYENNFAYFYPVCHILKHNLAYFVFVDLATLVERVESRLSLSLVESRLSHRLELLFNLRGNKVTIV